MDLNLKDKTYFLLATFLLAACMLLVGLHKAPVPSIDGSIRAVEARNIVEKGQWLPIPFRAPPATVDVLDHPPLYVWVQAASMHVFGVNDFAANLPARLAAVLSVVLLFILVFQISENSWTAFAAAVVLLTTRDFILNSVRGYVEPYFILFTLLSLIALNAKRWPRSAPMIAGISSWLVLFTKGPPGIWTFVFSLIFILVVRFSITRLISFIAGFSLAVGLWAAATTHYELWPAWRDLYWRDQILFTVVGKRNSGALPSPLYFLERLVLTYWPWFPLMLLGYFKLFFQKGSKEVRMLSIYPWGIIGGFSLISWKYWYYTVPALPLFALIIAIAFEKQLINFQERFHLTGKKVFLGVCSLTLLWSFNYSVFPVSLNLNRIPEVTEFKNTIINSPYDGAVGTYKWEKDFNMLQTTGEWAFARAVDLWTDLDFGSAQKPQWMITDLHTWNECPQDYCKKGVLMQSANDSALVLLNPIQAN